MDTHTFWTTVGLITTAVLIITPLAHRVLGGRTQQRLTLHVTGALVALSFTIHPGIVAAAMTLPWLGLGVVLAVHELRTIGLAALVRGPHAAVKGPLAAWAWMAAGASWLTAHRLGLQPFGFDRAITLLTVAHFHVAGLGLTALMLSTHRRRPGTTLLAAIWLHQAGMITVAVGLTFDDRLEVAGATVITLALAIWASIAVRWIRDGLHGLARVLLVVATVAWILPMVLAIAWSLGPLLPEPVVSTFETMLRAHAALQTFGLVLCGLTAVLLTEPAADDPLPPPSANTDSPTEDIHDVAHQTNI